MSAHFQRGSLLYQQGRYDQAIGELYLHLGQQAEDFLAHGLLALCFAEQEKFDEATQHAQQAIHFAPDHSFGHYALAQVMLQRRRLPEARAAIKQAIEFDPHDPDYFAILASIYLQQSQWHEALATANQGLALDPEHAACTNLRAQAQVKLGDKAAAAATMAEALARKPDDPYTHANQGWTLLHQRQPRQALEHFREALRLEPEMEWARAGIVEAMKARNPLYRWILAYFLWMARLSPQVQWGLVIGLFIGQRVLRGVAQDNPALGKFLWPLLYCYVAFVLLTWLAYPLFNLLLRLDRFGRHALSPDQVRGANVLLACVAVTLAFLGFAIATGNDNAWYFTLVFGLLSLPASSIYLAEKGWPRQAAAAMTLVLLGAILSLFVPIFILGKERTPLLLNALLFPVVQLLPLALVASQFVANYLIGARVRK